MPESSRILKFLGLTNAIDHIKALVDTRTKLLKLEIKEELAKVLSNALISFVLLNLLFFALLLLSIGLSIYFGGLLGNYFYGFALMSGFYVVLLVLLILLKDKIGLKEAIEKQLNSIFNTDK